MLTDQTALDLKDEADQTFEPIFEGLAAAVEDVMKASDWLWFLSISKEHLCLTN